MGCIPTVLPEEQKWTCVLGPAPCAALPGSWLQWQNGTSSSLCRGAGDVCDS